MDMLYFLTFVGACAVGLVWCIRVMSRKQKNTQASNKQPQRHDHVRRHDPLRHGHARRLNPQHDNLWGNRRQHAGENVRGAHYSITANKIDFDNEAADSAQTEGNLMTEVKYTPTEPHHASSRKP